ncbi:hypothetical protein FSPOR_3003 [Fusarium sporotrichioides]|uniref:Uncharacterized protein n=1 Tax=Fusarium sporotrichioides TaxID=5514 RepID=A0A395SHK9_FUSSP|nr:hypothetical protein FSPOR_3003 [Fusarium sporotrichioides]
MNVILSTAKRAPRQQQQAADTEPDDESKSTDEDDKQRVVELEAENKKLRTEIKKLEDENQALKKLSAEHKERYKRVIARDHERNNLLFQVWDISKAKSTEIRKLTATVQRLKDILRAKDGERYQEFKRMHDHLEGNYRITRGKMTRAS